MLGVIGIGFLIVIAALTFGRLSEKDEDLYYH